MIVERMEIGTASDVEFQQYIRWFETSGLSPQVRSIERDELVVALSDGVLVAGVLSTQSPCADRDQLWIDLRPVTEAGSQLYLRKMLLSPRHQSLGLLRNFLVALEGRACELNCDGIRLDCETADQPMTDTYQDVGYFPRGCFKLEGAEVLRFDKDINASRELIDMLPAWQADLVGTLLFVIRDEKVLLIRKKRGHGAGKINGPGGKPEGAETPLECVLRETMEEVGIEAIDPKLVGKMKFVDTDDQQWRGYVFVADAYRGEPRESSEAIPQWFGLDEIPYAEMWEDDQIWLPRVLAGEKIEGEFLFTRGRLRAHRLTTVRKVAASIQ